MSQITHGVRAILSHPAVYSAFQGVMGARSGRRMFVDEFVRPSPGMKVLDVGCGPADILSYLPPVEYWGFDISEAYIRQARKCFGSRGLFHCAELDTRRLDELPSFDIVLAIGVIHHLDDAGARELVQLASRGLKPGGRLVTVDPCLDPTQSRIARFLVRSDRGRNVRDRSGYEAIARTVFDLPRIEIRHRSWIPYTHCFMECVRRP